MPVELKVKYSALGVIPWDVILIIMSVIAAITAMQVAGGLDYLVQIAERALRKNPKKINFLIRPAASLS